MNEIFEKIELEDCPCCGGAGLLEEEGGWCWFVTCVDCGAHTGHFEYRNEEGSREAAAKAARVWNMGKVISSRVGE